MSTTSVSAYVPGATAMVAPVVATASASVTVEYGDAALPSGASLEQVAATWMASPSTCGYRVSEHPVVPAAPPSLVLSSVAHPALSARSPAVIQFQPNIRRIVSPKGRRLGGRPFALHGTVESHGPATHYQGRYARPKENPRYPVCGRSAVLEVIEHDLKSAYDSEV